MAKHLKRSVVGIRLKAKRLGLHKKDAGMSALEVAGYLGVDATTVGKVWIRKGVLPSKRVFYQGPYKMHLISDKALRTFIVENGQYLDLAKVPLDSPYRDLVAKHSYIALPDVILRTGHQQPFIWRLVDAGVVRAARRGIHWYIAEPDIALIPHRTRDQVAESRYRRQSVLEQRRNRRKGVSPTAINLRQTT